VATGLIRETAKTHRTAQMPHERNEPMQCPNARGALRATLDTTALPVLGAAVAAVTASARPSHSGGGTAAACTAGPAFIGTATSVFAMT
jgi:hypothetical protein